MDFGYRGKQREAALSIAAISGLVEDKSRNGPRLRRESAAASLGAPFLKKAEAVPYIDGYG